MQFDEKHLTKFKLNQVSTKFTYIHISDDKSKTILHLQKLQQHDQENEAGEKSPNGLADVGSFAIQQHNNNENVLLENVKVLKAKERVVTCNVYALTMEAFDAGKRKKYEAKFWVRPRMNFKRLQEFNVAHVISPFMNIQITIPMHKIWYDNQVQLQNTLDLQDMS
ncbi:cysteine proteinase inhibitor 12-like [Lathyrus oleraceus]|uniref:cysteine proteinase inhibitor 12-like n=1 Tax=Pisum sativum TaxID=3888 RepID=UPI001FC3C023|nr:cysteine proteinase inhibitor 12-like [Pisum sativum]